MSELRSCREAYTETLGELATQNPDLIVLSSDARGSCSLTGYVDRFPEQYVEIGIAEQNLMGLSAGLPAVGMKPNECANACF